MISSIRIYHAPNVLVTTKRNAWTGKNSMTSGGMGMKEIWKAIEGYEGLYEVSNMGRVRSLERWIDSGRGRKRLIKDMILKESYDKGYPQVCLRKNNRPSSKKIHRLVALNHIPNKLNKKTVNHIDGNKKNNHVENLEWVTQIENNKHAQLTGLRKDPFGENHSRSKLSQKSVLEIRNIFSDIDNTKTHKEVAAIYGVSKSTISSIVTFRNWKHLEREQESSEEDE